MPVLASCKFDIDPIKNEGAIVSIIASLSVGKFFVPFKSNSKALYYKLTNEPVAPILCLFSLMTAMEPGTFLYCPMVMDVLLNISEQGIVDFYSKKPTWLH